MLNNQRAEPKNMGSGLTLDVIEVFHTLQGEGPYSGQAAIFVRLAGCNLQCPQCDTIYTGPKRQQLHVDDLVDVVNKASNQHPKTKLVVITGGEPLRQSLGHFIGRLLEATTLAVQIETNGIYSMPVMTHRFADYSRLCVVVSPKTSKIHAETAHAATAFKYVLSHDSLAEDGLPTTALGHKAKPHVARPPKNWVGNIYVNPCDDKDPVINQLNLDAARDSALRHGYILGVQLHKIVQLP